MGAGKTIAAPFLLRDALAVREYVNADPIAVGLSGFAPETVAIAAGRVMLARIDEVAAARVSFGFETTLASRFHAPWLRSRLADGYRVHLVFLWLASPQLALARAPAWSWMAIPYPRTSCDGDTRLDYRISSGSTKQSSRVGRCMTIAGSATDRQRGRRYDTRCAGGTLGRHRATMGERMTETDRVGQAIANGVAEDALQRAAESARRAYVRAGLSMPVWRNGHLVWIEPAELERYDAVASAEHSRAPHS